MKIMWIWLLLATEIMGFESLENLLSTSKYHSHSEMTNILKYFNRTYHNLTNLYSIGTSTKGRELWALEVSAGETSGLGRPNVKLIGNIHGNEPVGRELLLQFAKYLVEMYNKDIQVTRLLNFARVHILPSLNPDGFELAMHSNNSADETGCISSSPGRKNYHNFDLNRNFPDHFEPNNKTYQSETLAIKNWLERIPFVLSASLHGGALLVSYPYDNREPNVWEEFFSTYNTSKLSQEEVLALWKSWRPEHGENVAHLTPDDDVFKHLASVYANAHPTMHQGKPCPGSSMSFPKGITNGAAWYKVKGGMQDFNYIDYGCMELTLEISCCKFPNATELPRYWEHNKKAFLAFVNEVHRGVRGVVKDEAGTPVANATVHVLGRDIPFRTTSSGEFWRILLPHVYIIQVSADGFQTATIPIKVSEPDPSQWSQIISITLHRSGTKTAFNASAFESNFLIDQDNEIHFNTSKDVLSESTTVSDGSTYTLEAHEMFPNESEMSSGTAQTQSQYTFCSCVVILCCAEFYNIIKRLL